FAAALLPGLERLTSLAHGALHLIPASIIGMTRVETCAAEVIPRDDRTTPLESGAVFFAVGLDMPNIVNVNSRLQQRHPAAASRLHAGAEGVRACRAQARARVPPHSNPVPK